MGRGGEGEARPADGEGRGGGGGAPDGALHHLSHHVSKLGLGRGVFIHPPVVERRGGVRSRGPAPRRSLRADTLGELARRLILGGGAGGRTADALHARRGVRPVIRGGEKRALKLEELLLGVRTADPRELGHRATREVGARRDALCRSTRASSTPATGFRRDSRRYFPGTIVTSGAAPRGQATLRALVAGHVGFANPPSSVERRAAKHRVSNSSPRRYVREPTREPRRRWRRGGAAPVSTLPEGGEVDLRVLQGRELAGVRVAAVAYAAAEEPQGASTVRGLHGGCSPRSQG